MRREPRKKLILSGMLLAVAALAGCESESPKPMAKAPAAKATTESFLRAPAGYKPPAYAPYGPYDVYEVPRNPLQGYLDSVDEFERKIDANAAEAKAQSERDQTAQALQQLEYNQQLLRNKLDDLQYGY